MDIVRIISGVNNLLSVFNEDEEMSEFRLLFKNWYDIEYLTNFFESNKSDLDVLTIDEAVEQTVEDADRLEESLLSVAESDTEQLQSLFKPLFPSEYRLTTYQREKAYGTVRRSWLRVYAIRINPNLYVVTGGAIKMTQKMQDRPHTQKQLKRLAQVRDYLHEFGFTENDIESLRAE